MSSSDDDLVQGASNAMVGSYSRISHELVTNPFILLSRQYKAEYGHTVVPQNSGQLGAWVHSQRVHYKKYKNGQKSQMTAEKALRLTEIGFCFNASDRYRGNKRHRTDEQQQEEEAQLQQQQQGYQQIHQLQETVLVPQGFQAYM